MYASRDMADRKKLLTYGGLGLIGFAGLMILNQQPKAKSGAPPSSTAPGATVPGSSGPSPTGTAKAAPPLHMSLVTWIASNRPDIIAGIQQARYFDVMGQFLSEMWPDFLARADVIVAPLSDQEGQWLIENASGFWVRPDIQTAWFGYPPRKSDVIGQYIRENGGGRFM